MSSTLATLSSFLLLLSWLYSYYYSFLDRRYYYFEEHIQQAEWIELFSKIIKLIDFWK